MTREDLQKELDNMWKEKRETEKLDPEDTFIPAKESKFEDNPHIRINL